MKRSPFAQKLVNLRKEKGLSRHAMAKASGLNYHAIVCLEMDRSQIPTIRTLGILARFYNTSIDALIADTQHDPRNLQIIDSSNHKHVHVTKIGKKVWKYIVQEVEAGREPPTLKDLAKKYQLGFRTIEKYFLAFAEEGWIRRNTPKGFNKGYVLLKKD